MIRIASALLLSLMLLAGCDSPDAPRTGWNIHTVDLATFSDADLCFAYLGNRANAMRDTGYGRRAKIFIERAKPELQRRGIYEQCMEGPI